VKSSCSISACRIPSLRYLGRVPAVALWVPFNITLRDKVPGAKKLVDASAYYPQAAIMSGWATTADFHVKNRERRPTLPRTKGKG
jgi:hypothetical protein